eukprot:303965-Hanusia_phi.AAC.1
MTSNASAKSGILGRRGASELNTKPSEEEEEEGLNFSAPCPRNLIFFLSPSACALRTSKSSLALLLNSSSSLPPPAEAGAGAGAGAE